MKNTLNNSKRMANEFILRISNIIFLTHQLYVPKYDTNFTRTSYHTLSKDAEDVLAHVVDLNFNARNW